MNLINSINYRRFNTTVLFLFLLPVFAFSQTPMRESEILEKYWNNRERLTNLFTKPDVHSPMGSNLPALMYKNKRLYWSDGTLNLGWYMGVLATEFHILRANNQPTDNVVELLYGALSAFDRLDMIAERAFYPQVNSFDYISNGFFIRDDVTDEFVSNNWNADVVSSMESGYMHKISDPANTGNNFFMTADQLSHLMIGYTLIKRCIPADVNYRNIGINENLRAMAERQVEKVFTYLSSVEWTPKFPGSDIKVKYSSSTNVASYALGNAAEYVKSDVFANTDSDGQDALNKFIWQGALDRIDEKWWWGEEKIHFFAKAYMMLLVSMDGETSWDATSYNSGPFTHTYGDRYNAELAHLLYSFLHNKPSQFSKERINSVLAAAPYCGPYFYSNGTGNEGWRAHNRFEKLFNSKDGDVHKTGQFTGLDYMLFYNLYHILFRLDKVAPYYYNMQAGSGEINFNFEYSNTSYQTNKYLYGSDQDPAYIFLKEPLSSTSTIGTLHYRSFGGEYEAPNHVTFASANSVTLKPGFQAKTGSEFRAVILESSNPCTGWLEEGWEGPASAVSAETTKQAEEGASARKQSEQHQRASSYKPLVSYLQDRKDEQDKMLENSKNPLLVYPNPAQAYLNVKLFLGAGSSVKIYLVDFLGKEYRTFKDEKMEVGVHQFKFETGNIPSGTYKLVVQTGDNKYSETIIKL